ncbi:MAG: ComEC/Rec2 family competence protein [Gammaproteobacteria bacterium]|nr:ComEC/Rec2 family competence protein [Gammaproteobacteria bacterium]
MKSHSYILVVLIIVLLAWHASFSIKQRDSRVLDDAHFNHPMWVTGVVMGLPSMRMQHRVRFELATKNGKFLLDWYGSSPHLKPGDTWRLLIKLKPIAYFNNPGEFDYAAFLHRQGIVAKGYVIPHHYYHRLSQDFWSEPINNLRLSVRDRLMRATYGEANQGVMVALILGDKTGLTPESWHILVNSGTSYFVVISGLHIALLAGLIFMIVRYLWPLIPGLALCLPAQKAAGLAGLFAALVYSVLAGFTVPTQRAFITIMVLGGARFAERNINSFQAWFLALCLVILWNPLSLYEAGFWLSFLAVWFLLYAYVGRIGRHAIWHNWIYPQWVIFWGILPISLYYFHQVSLVSLLTNIIAIPIMMIMVIPGALFGTVLLFIWPALGKAILTVSSLVMSGLWRVLHYFASQAWWGVYLPEPSIMLTAIGIVGAALILAPRAMPARYLGLIFILPLFIGMHPKLASNQVVVHTLHAPDGRVLIVQTQGLVAVSQNNSNSRQAESVARGQIMPYLHAMGINAVECWQVVSPKPLNGAVFRKIVSSIRLKFLLIGSDDKASNLRCKIFELNR